MFRKVLKVPHTADLTNDEIIERVKESSRSLKRIAIMKGKRPSFGHMIMSYDKSHRIQTIDRRWSKRKEAERTTSQNMVDRYEGVDRSKH